MNDEDYERGSKTRREVLGDEHVERFKAGVTEFAKPFMDFVTGSLWGVWARDGLDRRLRSVITLTALTILRQHDELPLHVRAALRNGLTAEEIAEIMLHITVYAGAPAGLNGTMIAERVLAELGEPTAQPPQAPDATT